MFRLISRFTLLSITLMNGYFHTSLAMQEISTIDQYHEIISQTRPSVILFYSPTCPVCKKFKPIYLESAKNNAQRGNFFAVDATKSEFRDVIFEFGIQEVPVVIYKEVGFKNKAEFNKTLNSFFGTPTKITKATAPKRPKPVKKTIIAKNSSAQKILNSKKTAQKKGTAIQKLAFKGGKKNNSL